MINTFCNETVLVQDAKLFVTLIIVRGMSSGFRIFQCVQYMVYDFKNVYNVTLLMNNEDDGVIDGTFNEKKRNSDIDKNLKLQKLWS